MLAILLGAVEEHYWRFGGWLYGVTDHNIVDVTSSTNGIWVWHDSYSSGTNGNGAWADTTGLGSSRFIFVENNTINNLNGSGNGFPTIVCMDDTRCAPDFDDQTPTPGGFAEFVKVPDNIVKKGTLETT